MCHVKGLIGQGGGGVHTLSTHAFLIRKWGALHFLVVHHAFFVQP